MKICTVKSPFFWILLVVVVFVIIGGFWYVNIPSPELEEAEIALNRV
ncbi:MAG: hypothetical protein LBO09_03070 [Candidatus Peribacteria bacterium]|jgi:hypothetical protein|nr:hypothetical protein [Candidatus Peribacteria bacterium]